MQRLINKACTRPMEDWGLDPLFWTSAKLFISDLHSAIANTNGAYASAASSSAAVFFVGNEHVVRSVELVGVVVSVDARGSKMTVYQIDDGTGIISCVHFTTTEEQNNYNLRHNYELGITLCIEGRLSTFRDERQVIVRVCKQIEPNQETLAWLERLSLRKFLSISLFQQQ
ncbi:hypothetical protein BX661DRAFT_13574 [Kickxella alabastrina]|uniref:uncharacterized protein n=1 Tax=Kickxella alabastrina TaxID=61397 RepID=UPI00221F68EF|nr:uncharacterized protein BX661DRAFT_13574 [Kickxella alabastrina]KAI7828387.1 hypothetical protein BX661DRAFT_13574 [Kickxella alabastrina]